MDCGKVRYLRPFIGGWTISDASRKGRKGRKGDFTTDGTERQSRKQKHLNHGFHGFHGWEMDSGFLLSVKSVVKNPRKNVRLFPLVVRITRMRNGFERRAFIRVIRAIRGKIFAENSDLDRLQCNGF
jgi:hypothetical protein